MEALLARAYRDCGGTGLVVGGLLDNPYPRDVRIRLQAEIQEDGEAWLRGRDDGWIVSCQDVLRFLGISAFSGSEWAEMARAGVRWPPRRRW